MITRSTHPRLEAEAYDVIRDILRSLGDPFSRFVDPAAFAPLLKYDISGVGLNIAEDASDPTRLRVLGLVLDSPAARAGVKQGDELVSVDGVETRNKSAFQAVSLIQAQRRRGGGVGRALGRRPAPRARLGGTRASIRWRSAWRGVPWGTSV